VKWSGTDWSNRTVKALFLVLFELDGDFDFAK
jgi:hypothetical protein